jgi:dienelactone hydrolase
MERVIAYAARRTGDHRLILLRQIFNQEEQDMTRIASFLVLSFGIALSALADQPVIDPYVPFISYVTFSSLDPAHPLTVAAQLRVPADVTGKMPAVVIVHGSSGVDSRGKFYAEALNRAGIATLEIDMWAARGWLGGITGRPRGVPETLPDAYGALKFLTEQPRIDASRIGIMGFSWGGVVSMLTATQRSTTLLTGGLYKFAAHAPNYPVCWVYNHVPGYAFKAFTGSPVFIQAGELDAYDNPDTCPNLVHLLPASAQTFISVKVYKGATHAWDRLQPAITVTDPFSHLGAGGQVEFVPNPHVAMKSRHATLRFFQRAFGMAETSPQEGDHDDD